MKAGGDLLNLDILALSLLCCLLASVVGVLVLGGEETAPAKETYNPRVWKELRQQSARLTAEVQEVERSRESLAAKITYSALDREKRTLQSRVNEIERKINLMKQLLATKEESERLTKALEEKEKTLRTPFSTEARRMLGEYKGPYVLVECVEDKAFIYPGKMRIGMKAGEEEVQRLVNQIAEAGFVAFVVRPAGWYDNSYDQLKQRIYRELDKMEKRGKSVGRSTLPLDESAPIANYLPPERN